MKEINRFYIMGNKLPSDDGSIVSYKDHAAIVAAKDARIAALQEQVRSLASENISLKKFCKNAAFYADYEAELGMERGGFTDALNNIETSATDAALREIRAQGIHFAANRILAAWESGFIDDTPAMVFDISGAVLSAIEFLPNADEDEFKRDYADEVRARIRAGEQP